MLSPLSKTLSLANLAAEVEAEFAWRCNSVVSLGSPLSAAAQAPETKMSPAGDPLPPVPGGITRNKKLRRGRWRGSGGADHHQYSQDGEGPAAGGGGHAAQGSMAAVQQPPPAAAGERARPPMPPWLGGRCHQQCQQEKRAARPGQAHGGAGPSGGRRATGQGVAAGLGPGAGLATVASCLTARSGIWGFGCLRHQENIY